MIGNVLIPDPLDNDCQYARFYHLDITSLDDTELIDELNAVRPLLWGLPLSHWLRERAQLLQDELSRRKWDAKAKPRPFKQESQTPMKAEYKGLSSNEG